MLALLALSALFAGAPPGPDAVGFEVRLLADAARLREGAPRPLQLSIWYPALHGGRALRYRDYVALAAGERKPASADDEESAIRRNVRFLRESGGMTAAEAARWMTAPMLARADAPVQAGAAPLVLFAPGNGNAASDYAPLCELIASYGFVVGLLPSQSRIDGPLQDEDGITAAAEAQAADLEFAARAMRLRPGVDATRTALVAHSFGARSALLFAMGNEVAALVSLDGGIGTRTGQEQLARSKLWDAARGPALLHIFEELDPFMAPDFTLLRKLRGKQWLVRAEALHHVHFTAVGAAVALSKGLARATGAGPRTARAHGEVLRATVAFLRSAIAGSPQPPAKSEDLQPVEQAR